VAKKGHRKITPEERARHEANQKRLEEVIQRRLERDGLTREDVFRRVGLPDPRRPSA
jgi:hypothetical protein